MNLVRKLRKIKLTARRQGDLHHITVSLHLPVESIKLKVTKSSDQGYVQGRPKLKSVRNFAFVSCSQQFPLRVKTVEQVAL